MFLLCISRLFILYFCSILPREVFVHGWDFHVLLKKSATWQSALNLSLTSRVQLQTLHRVVRSSLSLNYLSVRVSKPRCLSVSKSKWVPLPLLGDLANPSPLSFPTTTFRGTAPERFWSKRASLGPAHAASVESKPLPVASSEHLLHSAQNPCCSTDCGGWELPSPSSPSPST